MKRNKTQRKVLRIALVLNVLLLVPLIVRKPPIKDWVIVYLFNAATNGVIDNLLVRHKIVRYPVRLLSKTFDTHLLFDYFLYPTFTIWFNQLTHKDKLLPIIYKLFLITLPAFFIEFWAERRTNLLEWSRKWKWYHSFFGFILKSLITRFMIGAVRKVDSKVQ